MTCLRSSSRSQDGARPSFHVLAQEFLLWKAVSDLPSRTCPLSPRTPHPSLPTDVLGGRLTPRARCEPSLAPRQAHPQLQVGSRQPISTLSAAAWPLSLLSQEDQSSRMSGAHSKLARGTPRGSSFPRSPASLQACKVWEGTGTGLLPNQLWDSILPVPLFPHL